MYLMAMKLQKLIVSAIAFVASAVCMDASTYVLNSGWEFQRVSKDVSRWHPAVVPGCIQTDLLRIGDIEDPYFRMNERDIQWIDKEDWRYRTAFDVPEEILSKANIFITFYGLDSYAVVTLNGR